MKLIGLIAGPVSLHYDCAQPVVLPWFFRVCNTEDYKEISVSRIGDEHLIPRDDIFVSIPDGGCGNCGQITSSIRLRGCHASPQLSRTYIGEISLFLLPC